MVDNCTTFLDAAEHLVKKCGADKVYIIATHGVLSGDAAQQIQNCDSVHKVRMGWKMQNAMFVLSNDLLNHFSVFSLLSQTLSPFPKKRLNNAASSLSLIFPQLSLKLSDEQ